MKFNLTIPSEMKAKMDAIKGVNWSEVARRCFEAQIKAEDAKQQGMEAGLARLRALKPNDTELAYQEGFEAGKRWALDKAGWEELRRIATSGLQSTFTSMPTHDTAAMAHLSGLLSGKESSVTFHKPVQLDEEVRANMENLFGREPNKHSIAGFMDGAKLVYESI